MQYSNFERIILTTIAYRAVIMKFFLGQLQETRSGPKKSPAITCVINTIPS